MHQLIALDDTSVRRQGKTVTVGQVDSDRPTTDGAEVSCCGQDEEAQVSKRGWVLFAAMGVIWGIPYLLIKVAVDEVAPTHAGAGPHGRSPPCC